MIKSMLGKLISFALTGVIIFAVAGCGDEEEKKSSETNGITIDEANGEIVSSAEAKAFLSEMEMQREELTSDNVSKYTYWLKTSIEMQTGATYSVTAGSRYSKDDKYLYTWTQMVDQPVYDYNPDGSEKSRIGTISGASGIYAYIDSEGKAIEAIHSHSYGTIYGEFDSNSSATWAYLNEEGETAEEAFEENLFSELLDVMATLLNYENQMAQAIDPMVSAGIDMPGIAVQSKGEGHLYVTMDMLGMSYIIEFSEYHLSYMKMKIETTMDPELKSMTTEMYFKVGECEVSYPDLSTYEYNENAITPDVDLDLDLD